MKFFLTSLFFSLTNPSPDEERDRLRSINEEKGDLDDESDAELDGNNQLESRSRLGAQFRQS